MTGKRKLQSADCCSSYGRRKLERGSGGGGNVKARQAKHAPTRWPVRRPPIPLPYQPDARPRPPTPPPTFPPVRPPFVSQHGSGLQGHVARSPATLTTRLSKLTKLVCQLPLPRSTGVPRARTACRSFLVPYLPMEVEHLAFLSFFLLHPLLSHCGLIAKRKERGVTKWVFSPCNQVTV